jgi:dipeptidase E
MSRPRRPTIVAVGGLGSDDESRAITDFVLGLTVSERPQVCFLPTAVGDDAEAIVRFYELFSGRGHAWHATLHPWPPAELRERLVACDLVWVSGGNTANMLALWRVHGVDAALREGWERGVVLAGWSAGMICWFEAGVTDSFGPDLQGMRDGLGLLPGSACPHYDGEELRRPFYQRLVHDGFPSGYAADDCVALRFEGTDLVEVVSARSGSGAYRVDADGERALDVRPLT